MHAAGTFEVKLAPVAPAPGESDAVGRMTIDKQFAGDLVATSQGQMLAHTSGAAGSAGYVAIEKVSGTLAGRAGSFVLQHSGVMTRGRGELSVTVVPDSGTGALLGLAGRMNIIIEGGKHTYVFEYVLP